MREWGIQKKIIAFKGKKSYSYVIGFYARNPFELFRKYFVKCKEVKSLKEAKQLVKTMQEEEQIEITYERCEEK